MSAETPRIRIGPSGWSYDDWHGIVYPSPVPRRFDALAFLSRYFNAIEINSTFYRPPAPRMVESWVRRVPPPDAFRFTVKLWQRFTHQRSEPYEPSAARDFLAALQPMMNSGHFGCLLLQFPWSFRCDESTFDWLARLSDDVRESRPVVEVRHTSWDNDEARERLRGLGLSYCNIDQPALRDCIGPASHVTGPIGYVRFHGRRHDTWFATDAPSHERYNYLYSRKELEAWAPRIHDIAGAAEETYVFTNNHYRGQGPANALQLRAMLGDDGVSAPRTLIDAFPELRAFVGPADTGPSERSLFD